MSCHLEPLPSQVILAPTVAPDKGNKHDRGELLYVPAVAMARDAGEHLTVQPADRDDQASPIRQLGLERPGDLRRSRRDEDGIKGSLVGQALAAIASQDFHVMVAELGEDLASALGQFGMALNAEDLPGQAAEDGCLIARAGAYLQHDLVAAQTKRLCHQRYDIRLGDSLVVADRQGAIAVGLIAHLFRHKEMAWHFAHDLEHQWVSNVTSHELFAHHALAQDIVVGAFARHAPLLPGYPSHYSMDAGDEIHGTTDDRRTEDIYLIGVQTHTRIARACHSLLAAIQ